MFYIVGLGNPGEKYRNTRHNIGRLVLEDMVDDGWDKNKGANALYTRKTVGSEPVELVLPETYMNRSGETVRYLIDKQEARLNEMIVIHDDIDLPFGEIKIAKSRGAGGNNGVTSIIKAINSKDFVRIRIGIAPTSFWTGKVKRPAGGGPLERFVLKPFSVRERSTLPDIYKNVSSAIDAIIIEGIDFAMNRFN